MSRRALALCVPLFFLATACEQPVAYGSYNVSVAETLVTGSNASCGLDTSSTDELAGTFFFNISTEADGEIVSLTGRLPDETSVPAAGSFSVPEEMTISAFVGEETIEPIEGTVRIEVFEAGLAIDFGSLSNLDGSMDCLP